MRNIKQSLLVIASILLVTTPAKADWQFTKWGMTPAELEKKSPIHLVKGDSNCPVRDSQVSVSPYETKYTSDWTVGSMRFTTCYLFLKNKLSLVHLFSKDVDEKSVIKGFSQKYGQPQVDDVLKDAGMISYVWDLPNEKIKFSVRQGLEYKYLVSYESKIGSDENAVRDNL